MRLNPADVKYVLITHGHSDHDEGATYFQRSNGARVMLGARDWDLIARRKLPGGTPKRDLVAEDGGKITLGDTTVGITLTPGHTPGAYGLIFQAKDRGQACDGCLRERDRNALRALRSFPNSSRHNERWRRSLAKGRRYRAALEPHGVRRRLDQSQNGRVAAQG